MRFISWNLLLVCVATFTYAQALPTFQHIIVIVQENRTPDNLFGSNITFESGVDLQQPNSGQWCLGACFDPGHYHAQWEDQYLRPLACSGTANAGLCTKTTTYCANQPVGPQPGQLPVPSCPQRTYVSSTYDSTGGISVVAPYFDIASKYGFANYFFQTNQGPSMPAHQFLFSGTSSPSGVVNQGYWNYFEADNPIKLNEAVGCTAPTGQRVNLIDKSGNESASVYPCFDHNSLPTLLDANHVSWKYYANEDRAIWNAPNAIREICVPVSSVNGECTGPDYINNDVLNPSQILLDLGLGGVPPPRCALSGVSWVIPNGDRSDHPGLGSHAYATDIEGGPAWVADIVNAVGQTTCKNTDGTSYWNTTAILIVWDDWGGFWDHVPPYEVLVDDPAHNKHCDPTTTFGCGYVSGFRVPFLVVSAYTGVNKNGTYSGYVSGACQPPNCPNEAFPYERDFGSILAFIENNFLGSSAIGTINAANQYLFADHFAPDYQLEPGAPDANYFINYNGPIEDPDNDVIDND